MQPMHSLNSTEDLISLLENSNTIAIVGLSPKEQRPSNMVGQYLLRQGYTIFPVNPGQNEILEQTCYADLFTVPERIDIVDIFRKSEDVLAVVKQAIELPNPPKAIWMQQGIINEEAASLAKKHGVMVIMDRCIKIDHQNLLRL